MAKIINLDELLPEDVVFAYQGAEYAIPGDLSVEQVFRLYELFQGTQEDLANEDGEADIAAATQRHVKTLQGELLKMFQIRQPDMRELPFGIRGTAVVISHVLNVLNPAVGDGGEDEESLPPISKKSSTKSRPRSSGSRTPRRSPG